MRTVVRPDWLCKPARLREISELMQKAGALVWKRLRFNAWFG